MTAGGPASSHLQQRGVVRVADVNAPRGNCGALDLGVATQAKVGIARHQHFLIDRTVRAVTGGAAFAQRFVLEDKGPRLVAVTLRATFVLPGHGQTAGRLEDVAPVRVVTLAATHMAFENLMMLRQAEFRVNVKMALEAGRWILAGVDDESGAAAGLDMFAAGTVAGFTAGFAHLGRIFKMDPGMRAGGEFADDIGMTVQAGVVANVMRAGDV